MSTLHDLHDINAWVLIAANAAVGAWCLLAHRFAVLGGRPVWGGVIVAQLTAVSQAVIGALLANRDDTVLDDMHALYGFSAIIAIGILYSYRNSPFMKGKELLLYGAGSLFIMGLGLRNLYLG
ncbi:MAG: hypothetical protein QNJ12_08915 [Ilumatobacter sp.]|uniref:hypothetical protein n=1 Tax=Ilumatobacter sp. TaxID=1967498 RepID=UPI0026259FCE|nr:hypothetical protein [Ilumatobacter sp.]MDJ0768902.1 hypothetical protein [Ilumatobacter sp.]